jgi:hypothetical protein
MKQPYLVSYDYGQGALWAFVLAESRADITSRHPDVDVVDAPPAWMSRAELEVLDTIDIDRPEGTWLAVEPGTDPSRD